MTNWHLITSEYPPDPGGVSGYSQLVANGLATEGETVHVWCPPSVGEEPSKFGVFVHREFGSFAPSDLRRVGKLWDHFPAPRRLLLQWVPQGYGYRSINLPFCWWLWRRAKLKHDRVEIMVHEPFLPFGEGSRKQDLAAAVHRLMMIILLSAASRIWVSIPDWERQLQPFVVGRKKSFDWLPVPSNIPVVDDPEGINRIRAQYALGDMSVVGHFGAYDRYMSELMLQLLPSLINGHGNLSVMLLGKGSLELRKRLLESHPALAKSVHATGVLSAEDISRHISACDVMLQPYQDGVSGRRTSVMTALSHGVPVVTTEGKATEKCWSESRAVKFGNVGDISGTVETIRCLLSDSAEAIRLGLAGKTLYVEQFDVKRVIKQFLSVE